MNTPNRLIRKPETLFMSGLTNSALNRLVRAGDFPQPILLVPGGRAIGFSLEAVQSWIANRLENSATQKPASVCSDRPTFVTSAKS